MTGKGARRWVSEAVRGAGAVRGEIPAAERGYDGSWARVRRGEGDGAWVLFAARYPRRSAGMTDLGRGYGGVVCAGVAAGALEGVGAGGAGVAGDGEAQQFGGAFGDAEGAGDAQGALEGVAAQESLRAVQLDGAVDHPAERLGRR